VLENLLAFVLLIGPLIFVHELGHLIAAKLVDVKVHRFSIGFGPALAKLRLGETQYVIAPIPLGGYVSMLGQRPDEEPPPGDAERSLANKPLWARYFVLGAGPAANLILPVIVYFFFYVLSHTMVSPPVIGTVVPGSAAEAAGLQQGDRIVAIEGRDVRSWSEMAARIARAPGQELKVQVERDGKRLDRVVTPQKIVRKDQLGVPETRGLLGVDTRFFTPQIGIIDPESPAYAEGLRTGDIVTSIDGEPVRTIEELERMLEVTGDALVRLTYLRPSHVEGPVGTLTYYESHHAQLLPKKNVQSRSDTGILPARSFVRAVDPGSPAAEAGVKAGDQILSVDGEPFDHWGTLERVFARAKDEPVAFEVQSPGQAPRRVELTMAYREWKDIYDQDRKRPWIGLHGYDKHFQAPPEQVRGRFTYAVATAVSDTASIAINIWRVLAQVFSFERGVDEFTSVVGIYKVAGTAYERGPGEFLSILALLSINLGVINLLPIPVLDGGHILFFTIEAVRRRPLSQRAREISSAIGLILILLLFLITIRNDLLRYWL
jgi:regulator of sigma E protease